MDKSDQKLDAFVDLLNGLFMFTYNHHLVIEPDGHESHEFNHITIDAPTRERAVAGLVALRFTLADEIALINNKLSGHQGADEEYNAYMAYRDECKLTADRSIEGYEAVE